MENSQVAIYLVYAGERRHAAVDRELYIPRSWTCDPDRCRAAGFGEDTVFATKPELAHTMIERFLDAGHHVGWVTGDEVYGGNPKLRTALAERGIGYILAVARSAEVPTHAGKFRAEHLVKQLPTRARRPASRSRPRAPESTSSTGAGAQGAAGRACGGSADGRLARPPMAGALTVRPVGA